MEFNFTPRALPYPRRAGDGTNGAGPRIRAEISDEDARWKPAPDRFSIAEVLACLSHSEGHCYRARVDRFLAEEMPELEPNDAQMYLEPRDPLIQ